jgi:hypothetical protein
MPSLAPKFFAVLAGLTIAAAPAVAEDAVKKKRVKHKTAVTERTTQARGTGTFRAGPLNYNGGEYLGDDPDPNIRFQIWRDLGAHFGSGD